MGTRADFYVGHGPEAEWLGSVAMDGYEWHEKPAHPISSATTPDDFRAAVAAELAPREDATLPAQGWPWPWEDSRTTDYAYVFDGGSVHVYCFGRPASEDSAEKRTDWPDMTARQRVTLGERSGLFVVRSGGGSDGL